MGGKCAEFEGCSDSASSTMFKDMGLTTDKKVQGKNISKHIQELKSLRFIVC